MFLNGPFYKGNVKELYCEFILFHVTKSNTLFNLLFGYEFIRYDCDIIRQHVVTCMSYITQDVPIAQLARVGNGKNLIAVTSLDVTRTAHDVEWR